MTQLVNLKFKDHGSIMRIRRGLILEMTWIVCLIK